MLTQREKKLSFQPKSKGTFALNRVVTRYNRPVGMGPGGKLLSVRGGWARFLRKYHDMLRSR